MWSNVALRWSWSRCRPYCPLPNVPALHFSPQYMLATVRKMSHKNVAATAQDGNILSSPHIHTLSPCNCNRRIISGKHFLMFVFISHTHTYAAHIYGQRSGRFHSHVFTHQKPSKRNGVSDLYCVAICHSQSCWLKTNVRLLRLWHFFPLVFLITQNGQRRSPNRYSGS